MKQLTDFSGKLIIFTKSVHDLFRRKTFRKGPGAHSGHTQPLRDTTHTDKRQNFETRHETDKTYTPGIGGSHPLSCFDPCKIREIRTVH